MNTEEKYELIEVEEDNFFEKVKEFFAKIGRRHLIIIGAVLLVGVAICLNWVLFANNNDDGFDYNEGAGVEVAGVFDSEPKANEARNEVAEWLSNDGYEDFEVYVLPIEKNMLKWYDIEKYM